MAFKILVDSYASKKQRKEKYCSPLYATDEELKNLPSAVIQTCEWDSVRLNGDLYAKRLKKAGVHVKHRCTPKAEHGCSEADTELAHDWQQYYDKFLKGLYKVV